jgi:uncharacterized DUF497 family protein
MGRSCSPAGSSSLHTASRVTALGVTGVELCRAVFTRRGDKLRSISCRTMRKREKDAYDA